MDPQVYGKLLTTHRRGKDVDLEALQGRFPLRQSAGEGSKMRSLRYRRFRRWKLCFVVLLDVFGVYEYIQEEEVGRWSHEGPTRVGGAPTPLGRAGHCRGCLVCCLTSTPSLLDCVCSEKIAPEGFIPFGLRLIFLFFETLKQAKKQQFGLGLRLVGQSQNDIKV